MYQFPNPTSAFVNLLEMVYKEGTPIVVRGSETRELLNVALQIDNPSQRCLVLPYRHDNIFAKIAETLWVIAGRNDIQWLSYYLPRAPEYSDDKIRWRAGYGPRLRKWIGPFGVTDQVHKCLDLLQSDPNTRRAVMSLWNPAEDYVETLDTPCNNWLHWLIRDGKLRLNISQRSSDILYGFSGINLFEWSVLQEFMARWLGLEIGPLTYFISSLHLYKQHYERGNKIEDAWTGETIYDIPSIQQCCFGVPFEMLDNALLELFIKEADWRGGAGFTSISANGFLNACAKMLYIFISDRLVVDRQEAPDRVKWLAINLDMLQENTDFRLAAIEYYARKLPSLWNAVKLTDAEKDALKLTAVFRRT